jgi:acyl-CoA thioester hydrolase
VRPTLPSYAEVRALPRLLERPASPRFEDANGHVSTTGQLAMHDEAAWPFLASVGIEYGDGARSGIMDLEYHLRFLAEVMVGDTFAVHARTVARDAKRFHALWFLVDVTHERIADTFEFVCVHVDLEARRSAPFPPASADALDELVRASDALDWPAPLCGAMGLR